MYWWQCSFLCDEMRAWMDLVDSMENESHLLEDGYEISPVGEFKGVNLLLLLMCHPTTMFSQSEFSEFGCLGVYLSVAPKSFYIVSDPLQATRVRRPPCGAARATMAFKPPYRMTRAHYIIVADHSPSLARKRDALVCLRNGWRSSGRIGAGLFLPDSSASFSYRLHIGPGCVGLGC